MRLVLLVALLGVSDGAVLTLHVKAGPDGNTFGDCPFAHALRIALEHKDLDYSLEPHAPDSKPGWLVANHGGAMPCLQDDEQVVTDSSSIADYLEKVPIIADATGFNHSNAGELLSGRDGTLACNWVVCALLQELRR